MFYQWLYGEKIHSKTLAASLGERRLSNLLHIAELIHLSQEREAYRVLDFLRKEITSARTSIGNNLEELAKLRIESDRNAVQIMTIHGSKGLEFPVVFCPCLSEGRPVSMNKNISYYEKEKKVQAYAPSFLKKILKQALGKESLAKGLKANAKEGLDWEGITENIAQENLAEELRLLYVALTRARERSYVFLSEGIQKIGSAAFHLFSGKGSLISNKTNSASGDSEIGFQGLRKHLLDLSKKYPQSIFLANPDQEEKKKEIAKLLQKKKINTKTKEELEFHPARLVEGPQSSISLYSFSRIVKLKKERTRNWRPYARTESPLEEKAEGSLVGENTTGEAPKTVSKNIFNFPKGIQAGSFFHEILENIIKLSLHEKISFHSLFHQKQDIKKIIKQALEKYNYSLAWEGVLTEHIASLFEAPLSKALSDKKETQDKAPSLSLNAIEHQNCTAELAFHFNLGSLGPEGREKGTRPLVLEGLDGLEDIGELWPEELRLDRKYRFLTGYIDFIFSFQDRFYILDWKSNFLGSQIEDYSLDKIEENMKKHSYHLQYYIYLSAFHRFLKTRKSSYEYEKHFGGVFYIYLRGVDRKCNTGLYFARPSLKELETFQSYTSR